MSVKPKILWGVCGIGHGHTFRQMPMIDHFAATAQIMIFAYGESERVLAARYKDNPNVRIERVAVPFYMGCADGLDFAATGARPQNYAENHLAINCAAMDAAKTWMGKPDLVISDYEPVAAQYAYAYGAKLVTIDQQSKYLAGEFPAVLAGQTYADEVQRLRMFFPKAEARLASSFFDVARKEDAAEIVESMPPVIGDNVRAIRREKDAAQVSILLYITSQQAFAQSYDDIAKVCAEFPDVEFHMFGRNIPTVDAANVRVYEHGDKAFHDVMARCHGIISTAGHTLLSEAMYLGIPVYAMPLALYEQQMNAHVIGANGFGMCEPSLQKEKLARFIENLPAFAAAIEADQSVLLRQAGQGPMISRLNSLLPR